MAHDCPMIRILCIMTISIALSASLSACSFGGPSSTFQDFQPFPGQGQYIRPDFLQAQPTPRIPPTDVCRSQLYAGLVGRHEGAIFLPGLPGRKRILKPAFPEGFGYEPEDTFYTNPPLVQVVEYLPSQALYAPAIQTVTDRINLGPDVEDRLTIELNNAGYVQEVRCQ